MIEAVFLDAGETILRPHPSFAELFAQVSAAEGVDVDAQEVRAVQESLAPHLVDIAEETGVEKPSLSPEASRTFWTYLYRRFLQELGIRNEALADHLYSTFSDASSYKLFDDVLPALEGLQSAGYRLGLISNFEQWLEEMLVELDVGHIFEAAVISGVEGVEKPDSKIYELALERMNVEPDRAVHVGDSITLDVKPARAVGMHVVLLDRASRYPTANCPRIASLEELPEAIAAL